jgi:hypothetical protein
VVRALEDCSFTAIFEEAWLLYSEDVRCRIEFPNLWLSPPCRLSLAVWSFVFRVFVDVDLVRMFPEDLLESELSLSDEDCSSGALRGTGGGLASALDMVGFVDCAGKCSLLFTNRVSLFGDPGS